MADDLPANLADDDPAPDETQFGLSEFDADNQSVIPFEGLEAPAPLPSTPPVAARWLAFVGILIGGLLGALIGYGTADLLTGNELWAAVGALVAGLIGAIGVGIVSGLTLRAMNEWREVHHPEAPQ